MELKLKKMEIYKKIHKAKTEIGGIHKGSTNPFFKSKYFDINELLSQVEPILNKYNLIVLQPILDNKVTTQIIDIETNEQLESRINLPNIQDPQKLGSAITYFRRYTLQCLLSLQADDDDANLASKPKPKPKPKPKLKITDTLTQEHTKQWDRILDVIGNEDNKSIKSIKDIEKHYQIDDEVRAELNKLLKTK